MYGCLIRPLENTGAEQHCLEDSCAQLRHGLRLLKRGFDEARTGERRRAPQLTPQLPVRGHASAAIAVPEGFEGRLDPAERCPRRRNEQPAVARADDRDRSEPCAQVLPEESAYI